MMTLDEINIPKYKSFLGMYKQLEHIRSEINEVIEASMSGIKEDIQDEILDVLLSSYTLWIHSIVDPVEREKTICRVLEKNYCRGYYGYSGSGLKGLQTLIDEEVTV